MKKLLLTISICLSILNSYSQTQLLYDDFSNQTNWVFTNGWGLSSMNYISPQYSMSESPNGNYQNLVSSSSTLANSFDLTGAFDCMIEFYARYDIELGFDFMYLEASPDNGQSWNVVTTFNGVDTVWVKYTFSLAGFVGNSQVKVRFRFESDQGYFTDGMYIDELKITSYPMDMTAPFIICQPQEHFQGSLYDQPVVAEVIDISGVFDTYLFYSVDGVPAPQTIQGIHTNGDNYLYTIPQQTPGAYINYQIVAIDDTDSLNTDTSDVYKYIAGNYIAYDNAQVDFVTSVGYSSTSAEKKAAVRFSLNGSTDLVNALIRNYTDINRPNDSMLVHIWADNNGVPGADLIEPIKVFPAATLEFPSQITAIDLRPFSDSLSGISGDIFVGFEVDTFPQEVWLNQTTPGIGNRSYVYGSFFFPSAWSLVTDDYHLRIITSQIAGAPIADFNFLSNNDPVVNFTDASSAVPANWSWDFDDGFTSNSQNPTHVFPYNATFNVCLTSSNYAGDNTICKLVTINNCVVPTAGFIFDALNDPIVIFTDTSLDNPTYWEWVFDDGTYSYEQNPEHHFSTNGSFNVRLVASNGIGSDTAFSMVNIVGNTPPTALFSYDTSASPIISFTDLSTDYPLNWSWNFGDGTTSTEINPVHTYATNGSYAVCLFVYNNFGSSSYCDTIIIDCYTAPIAYFSFDYSSMPTIYFVNETSDSIINSADSWVWDFGDGITSFFMNPAHIFTQNDTFIVCLTADNQIGDNTFCDTIIIDCYIAPTADFSYNSSNTPVVEFFDESSDSIINSPTQWLWDFGDGSVSYAQDPIHTYLSNGTFIVCLTSSNMEGGDTFCDTIEISSYSVPIANFTNNTNNCPSIQFTDLSQGIPTTWLWDFGDGTSGTDENPIHIYPQNGTYNVCVTVTNSEGTDNLCVTNSVTVNCYTSPTAGFSIDMANSPEIVFYDESSDSIINTPDLWTWNFGDGNSSNDLNPVHTFSTNGNYEVCLVVENSYGDDTLCQTIEIDAYFVPIANFTYNLGTSPDVSFSDQSTGIPDEWLWDFGDNSTSILQNPQHIFSTNGNFVVCLTASNYLGSNIFCQYVDISTNSSPYPIFSYEYLNDTLVKFTDLSTNYPDEWLWNFGDDSVSTEQNPIHGFIGDGTYNVCLTATNPDGSSLPYCENVVIFNTSVSELETSDFCFVYPNPMKKKAFIFIKNIGNYENINFEIYNILGKKLKIDYVVYENKIELSRGNLSSGTYLFKIKSQNNILKAGKLLVQ